MNGEIFKGHMSVDAEVRKTDLSPVATPQYLEFVSD